MFHLFLLIMIHLIIERIILIRIILIRFNMRHGISIAYSNNCASINMRRSKTKRLNLIICKLRASDNLRHYIRILKMRRDVMCVQEVCQSQYDTTSGLSLIMVCITYQNRL